MYVRRNIKWNIVLKLTWKNLLFFFIYSSIIVYIHHYVDLLEIEGIDISIPFLPVSTIGIAVAFYVGFKNNQAYDRFWEARKIWGGIVNYSRTWGNQVLSFVSNLYVTKQYSDEEIKEIHKRLIYRHIGWLYALKHKLRKASFNNFYTGMAGKLHHSRPDKETYDRDVAPFLPNNTPFPRQFAYFSKVFVYIFIAVMPFGLIGEFAKLSHDFIWLTVPFFMLIAWIFITMETVGDSSEDPFENFMNDVPMTALTRTIEIDLRQMLGETDLPPKIQAVNDILM